MLVSNQNSRAPSTRTVGRSPCRISKSWKTRQRRDIFKSAWDKGAMAFVECLGVSQENKMEGSLWRETLSRSLGSHDAAELVSGMCHANGCRQEIICLHAISCINMGWSSPTHNRVLPGVTFVGEDTWRFGERELAKKTTD